MSETTEIFNKIQAIELDGPWLLRISCDSTVSNAASLDAFKADLDRVLRDKAPIMIVAGPSDMEIESVSSLRLRIDKRIAVFSIEDETENGCILIIKPKG